MSHVKALVEYIGGLTIGQGRHVGEPFALLGWQRRFLAGAFRQPGDAALSLARGGGKSTLVAAIGAAAVDVGAPLVEPMAATIIVASSFDQGREAIFEHLLWFLRPSLDRYGSGPRDRFRIQDSANRASVTDRETGASVRVIGCDPRRGHGLQPRLLIADEVAQWPREKVRPMLAALKTSRGKIPDSKMLWLGTRPALPEHPFQRALDGHGVGYAQCHAARSGDPPFWRRTWARANPSLDHMPDLEAAIRSEAADAKRDPDALASFRALRLNQGVDDVQRSVLLDADTWQDAVGLPEPERHSGEYVLGLDLGQNAAMSAAAAYFRDGRLEACAVFPEVPPLAERGLGDGVGNMYVRMAERGELLVAGRRVSDVRALLAEALAQWGRPEVIVCDRWREAELRQHLEAVRFPLAELVIRGQGFKDGGSDVRDFRKAMLGDHVRPEESLLLTAAMSEARVTGDTAANWKLAKHTEGGRRAAARDEAAAAAILGVSAGFWRWHTSSSSSRPLRSALAG